MNFNIGRVILGFINPELFLKNFQKPAENNSLTFAQQQNQLANNTQTNILQPQNAQSNNAIFGQGRVDNLNNGVKTFVGTNAQDNGNITRSVENLVKLTENQSMNSLSQIDRSVYVKNLLGLPQELSTILKMVQNFNKPLMGGTLGMANINQDLLQNQKVLSELFQELNPTMQDTQTAINALAAQTQSAQVKSDAVALMFGGMVSLPEISKLIIQNSKQAVAALIISMASASKNGIDGKQLQDTLSVINSCVAMAESDNPALTLKSLMMLYLPWLPLNEGIGFDLEITSPDGENDSNDSKLTVLIQTKNYGNLKGVFTLTTSNSVEVYIICSDKFPKEELQKSLMNESTAHSMNTNIDIEDVKPVNEETNETRETKVNLSATNEMNPYLLLMAHSFIRNTILIDNGGSV